MGSQVIVNGEVLGICGRPITSAIKGAGPPDPDGLPLPGGGARRYRAGGAGSPAEINLKADDIVNMGMARMARAPVLLAGTSTGAGVPASPVRDGGPSGGRRAGHGEGDGHQQVPGDAALLRPGLTMLEELTQIPVVGVVPWLELDLDDEGQSLSPAHLRAAGGPSGRGGGPPAAHLHFHRLQRPGAASGGGPALYGPAGGTWGGPTW